MKLEEMTNAQLVNIILRKDDVETRLRAEITTLKKENKRIEKVCWAKTVGICMLFAAICIASFTLASCGHSYQRNHREDCLDTITAIDSSHSQVIKRCSMQDWGFETVFDTISFFGKPIVMDDWTSIHHQIRVIASEDDMLCYEFGIHNRTLSVGKVKFGVNVDGDGIILVSSTEVDAPKMKQVVEYLKGIYGVPVEDEPYNYWWHVGRDGGYHGKTVRMRPLHSEEGGTVLLFN